MSLPLVLGCLWVIAATGVAMMPMRVQYVPGVALLVVAPLLLVWIGMLHGWVAVVAGVFALVSMFRNPLRHIARRASGRGE